MLQANEYRLGYRGDIEGLRAVAILLVVAAHAGVPWLSGGFVGVDVFFVLSGFLITGLLTREVATTGTLGFTKFYVRRLRRLLPALLTMLLVTSLFAIVVLAPSDQGRQATAAATAAVWLSNMHFAFAKLDYFSPGAGSNLFLHTWSLGVEEQFYLLWPALVLWALMTKRGRGTNIARLKGSLLIVGAASLLACLMLTRSAPQMAFYLMPLRAWQFAAGALAWLYFGNSATASTSDPTLPAGNPSRHWVGWAGLALIVFSGVWFDGNMPYPGWRALLPTAGAVAALAAGERGFAGGVSRLLSLRPLQAIGRISYAWYLWHWPVLLLGASLVTHDSGLHRAGLVALSLLLAALSYAWIESPVRHQSRWLVRPGMSLWAGLGLMVTVNVACISWLNATAKWQDSPQQQLYRQARVDAPVIYSMGCDDWYHSDRVRICAFGSQDAQHTAALMGDSIGAQWFPALAEVFNRPGWRLMVLTKSSCPMVDEPYFYARIGREYVECANWRKQALLRIASIKPDIVMLGTVQSDNFSHSQWVQGTGRVLSVLSPDSGHVYLIRGTPHLPFDGPECLSARNWLPWLPVAKRRCEAPASNPHDDDVYRWLQEAANHFGNVTAIDMNPLICPNGNCSAERDGKVVFRDSQHLTASFVQTLGPALQAKLALGSRTTPATASTPMGAEATGREARQPPSQ
ncbi:Acyltransferase OS=Rhodanobacter lindaniclasticus OX=75310 GN=B1991_04940 PE=4 SV=1 [Rhodanobacter lindaniclasticus]